jgi:hypothetical protein
MEEELSPYKIITVKLSDEAKGQCDDFMFSFAPTRKSNKAAISTNTKSVMDKYRGNVKVITNMLHDFCQVDDKSITHNVRINKGKMPSGSQHGPN